MNYRFNPFNLAVTIFTFGAGISAAANFHPVIANIQFALSAINAYFIIQPIHESRKARSKR